MAHRLLPSVRLRYNYRCGYCGVSETETGGELTVDHFHPLSAGGLDVLDNLVYACVRCNQYKGAYVAEQNEPARRLLHPQRDDWSLHIHEDEASGELTALTSTGRFHIVILQLNRTQLVVNRQRRSSHAFAESEMRALRLEIAALRERGDRRELRLRELEARLQKLLAPPKET